MLSVLLLAAAVPALPVSTERVLDATYHHLGNDKAEEWPEASVEPEGTSFELEFEAGANPQECLLYIHQRDVDSPWTIELNGSDVGLLRPSDDQIDAWYVLPAGSLSDGTNRLRIHSEGGSDDITLGNLRLVSATRREHFETRLVQVRVTERDTDPARGLPVRLTLVDLEAQGEAPDVFFGEAETTAVRPGVVYTSNGDASFELPRGRYEIHALRGSEWGHAMESVDLTEPGAVRVDLSLAREVATPGFVAADTHIHTLTFSGHGDASVDERMVTLAGEGVELAIATDHNHQLDYRPYQEKLGLNEHFTPVVGNEVTTENGHFNAFPLPPGTDVPPYQVKDWVKLVEGIRAKGARVVILNHPRWPSIDSGPFGLYLFDRKTGERHADADGFLIAGDTAPRFAFDAMELVNSTTLQDTPHYILQDWFAILNHGERISAVGSSDSHTVGDPVGQGRTYVRSSTDDPARIDVDQACEAFLRGDTSVSLGIYAELVVDERFVPGALIPVRGGNVALRLRVAAPGWVRAQRVEVFVNGLRRNSEELTGPRGVPLDRTLEMQLPAPAQDAWLVCLVTGEGVKDPCWRTMKPYTMAATNPVWLDVDGDGEFRGPHAQARRLVDRYAGELDSLAEAMRRFDRSTQLQVMALMRARVGDDPATLEILAGDRSERENVPLWRYLDDVPGNDDR